MAANATELQQVGRRVTRVAADVFRHGTKASATSAILSVVIDSLVRKALELALAEADDVPGRRVRVADARQRRPPRGDAVVRRGQRAVVERRIIRRQARSCGLSAARTHDILDGCGLPSDRNGAVAAKASFARSQSDWFAAAEGWLEDPLRDRGLVFSSLLIDGRVVWGDPALHTVPAAYRRMRDEHPNALRLQLLDALSGKVRTRSLRDVLSRRGGTFDLKKHAVTPIVNLARWGGLDRRRHVGDDARPGWPRPAHAGAISQRDADTLCEVFVMLQRLRMAHQVEQMSAGHTPGRRHHHVGAVAAEPQPAQRRAARDRRRAAPGAAMSAYRPYSLGDVAKRRRRRADRCGAVRRPCAARAGDPGKSRAGGSHRDCRSNSVCTSRRCRA